MIKRLPSLTASLFFALQIAAQVTCAPVFPTVEDNVTITFDGSKGNGALAGFTGAVFAHMGLITSGSSSGTDWKFVKTTWGVVDPVGAMEYVSPGVFRKSFNIRQFYGVPQGETVLKMAFVFRNTNGSLVGRASDGSDIFYEVYPANSALVTTLVSPGEQLLFKKIGETIDVQGTASQSASLILTDNGQQIATANGTSIQKTINVAQAGFHEVRFIANTATDADTSTFYYTVPGPVTTAALPTGAEPGVQILDNQSVRFVLYAPGKEVVHLIGDFNDWLPTLPAQMKRTPDGSTWWAEITGLAPGQPVRFQYLVEGKLKIADPYSTLVLDPWNDGFINSLTYPNLLPYPAGKTQGIVSVVTPGEVAFNWQSTNYVRPKKSNLVVYELLMRDFLQRQNYQTLLDTLDYLEKLGINAIELMPVNEFDGNLSWGYNPAFHMALDKFYGSKQAFQTLIDECHKRGMAVILDAVFNHVTGASPLASLYWDSANNRPAANNPWLNPIPKHEFNVFNDFNHESQQTKFYVKKCLKHWLEEFKIDGFRFDLSKGFTQKNTLGSVGDWGVYDASRIAIWKDYASAMWAVDPQAYVILEHFADNTEEKELAANGMLIWGNVWGPYKDAALGHSSAFSANLASVSWKNRQYAQPHLIGYMESHDEDRIAYECLTYGNANGTYSVKNKNTALARIEMLSNLFYTVPGPKMLWQFGEMGYDYSINYCTNGTVNPNCRLDPKPVRWDYLQDPFRKKLHDVTRALLHLRKTEPLLETQNFDVQTLVNGKCRVVKLNGGTENGLAIANLSLATETLSSTFQHTGWWYDYFTGDSLNVTSAQAVSMVFKPSEYRLYFDKKIALPADIDLTVSAKTLPGEVAGLQISPNPANGFLQVVFDLENAENVRVRLLDVSGREMQLLVNERFASGEQAIFAELNLPPGVYFLEVLTGGGKRSVRKLIVN